MNAGDVTSRFLLDISGVGKNLKTAEQTLQGFGGKMKTAGTAMSLALSAPIAAAKGVIVAQMLESSNATAKLRVQLGLTADEAADLGAVAKSAWASGFGESITEVTQAVSDVRSNLGKMAEDELDQVTQGALMLSEVFQADVSESTAAAGVLMKNFGISGQEAFDIITTGFQQGGDYSGELLDTLREYAPQFSTMGMSADQMLGILISGAQEGAWNLDKVGDAVKEFNIRAKDGSKTTADGFKAIGLSAEKMGEAIAEGGEKGQQAFVATITALANMEDPVKRNTAGVALFGTQWEDLESKVVTAMAEGVKGVEGLHGATANAIKSMEEDNPALAFKKSLRELEAAVEPALKPIANIINNDVIPAVRNLTGWFNEMSPAGQKAIFTVAGLALVAGPATTVIGGLIGGIGTAAGWLGKVSAGATTAAAATKAVTAAAASGTTAIGTFTGGLSAAAGPWALAAGAIGATAYGIHSAMTEDAIPAVNLFADSVENASGDIASSSDGIGMAMDATITKISEATKKAVEGYLNLDSEAQRTLSNLYVNGTVITDQITNETVAKYANMSSQIKAGMDTHYQQQIADMQTFFTNSSALSETEEAEALAKLQADNETKKTEMDDYVKEIERILRENVDEQGKLTLEGQQKINAIQVNMKTNAVKALSEQEIESKIILERLKEYGTRITAEQASEIIKNAIAQRDQSVAAAEQQYDETVRNIIKMRDENKIITADQAEKMISEAQRQRDDSIKKAEELKTGVVGHVKEMNADIVKYVSDDDGHIKGAWNGLKEWFKDNPITRWINTAYGGMVEEGGPIPGFASGTSYFPGGLTYLNERGYELYDLPQGTRVYNHDASEDLVLKTAEAVAQQVLANAQTTGASIQQTNIFNSPKALDEATISRIQRRESQRLQLMLASS